MSDIYSGLNQQQMDAVMTTEGYVEIVAGAGTGKTHTIMCRTSHIINDLHVDPERILLITFTRKAANEMRERLERTVGRDFAGKANVCTFHMFCARMLNRYATLLGFDNGIEILTPSNQEALMTRVSDPYRDDARDAFFAERAYLKRTDKFSVYPSVKQLLYVYSDARNKNLSFDESIDAFWDEHDDLFDEYKSDALLILNEFNEEKLKRNQMDYDDLLYYMYYLLDTNDFVRNLLDNYFLYVMCDEYQDTNIVQDKILDALTRNVPNLCVIGDENQSIYAFRGAEIDNILTFGDRHLGSKRIVLYENYRSSQEILDFANAVINHAQYQPDVHLHGQFKTGAFPRFVSCVNRKEEAGKVVKWIKDDLANGVAIDDIAVMSRNSSVTNLVEIALQKAKIPFTKYGGIGFFERDHIVKVLSLVKMCFNTKYEYDWFRGLAMCDGVASKTVPLVYNHVLKYGVEGLSFEGLKQCSRLNARQRMGLSVCYDFLKVSRGLSPMKCASYAKDFYYKYMERQINNAKTQTSRDELIDKLQRALSDIDELIDLCDGYTSVESMLEDFALSALKTDVKSNSDKTLSVTTIHSAKGLEYNSVYLVGAVEGTFPAFAKSLGELDEERRCMYVALTRAKRKLFVTVPVTSPTGVASVSSFLAYPDVVKCVEKDGYIAGIDSVWNAPKTNSGWSFYSF